MPEGGVDIGPFHYRDMSQPLERVDRPPGAQVLRPHRPAAELRRHDRDRLGPIRGRHPPDADGRLARRRPHHGHPDDRAEPHRRPDRGDARGDRRRADHPQADPREPQGLRRDREGGRAPDQLPLLRLRRRRPRGRRPLRRGGDQRRPPGPAVQRPLPQREHVPLLRRRGGGEEGHGRRADLPDRRRPQRQRHREGRLARHARADGPARHQLRLLGRGRDGQGPDRPLHRPAERPARAEALVRPALRRRPARLLQRLQDAGAAEHPLHRGRHRGGRADPHGRHPHLDAHPRRHPEHDHARRGAQRAVALQQHPRRPDGQADVGRPRRHQGAGHASTTTARSARWCAT